MAGDLALENIEEFLFDEDRVVSYKWLSKTLSMHVNQAKSKLEEFAENWREKPDSKPITLTFFVSGVQETTSGNELTRVAIVKEEDLENVKKNLKKTLCEHIYSIQKSALKDTAVLYQTDFDETKKHLSECNKYSAIKCKSVQTRSSDSLVPIVSSVSNGRASPAEETKEKVGSSKPTVVPEKKKGLAAFVKQQKPQEKNETKPTKVSPVHEKKPSSTAKKGSLLHAFQSSKKASPKSETVAKEDTESPKVEKESKREDHAQEEKKTDEKTNEKKVPSSTKEDEAKSIESAVQKKETKEKLEKKKEITSSKKSSKRDMPDSDSESESKTKQRKGTKRRRVFQAESSSEEEESDHEMLEEEEEEEVEMDDTPIPPTPEIKSKVRQEEESVSPSTQEGNTEEGKKGRKKVWKKKRYLDDEGCMVTQRVFEYESGEGSDDEKETEKPTEKTSPSTKKDQSPQNQSTSTSPSSDSKKESPPSSGKRQQTALTSFFKKR